MSPEQARGRFVDERTDIWAFGCLLFEMLTGQPAFGGEDVMLTLARVLDRDTDLSSMPSTISPAVRHTIKLCLEKDPAKRIADIRDVRLALEGVFDAGAGIVPDTGGESRAGAGRAVTGAAGLVVGLLAAGLTVWIATQPAPATVERFVVPLENQTIQSASPSIAFAPSGRSFAYVVSGDRGTGAAELHLRYLDRIEPEILIDLERGTPTQLTSDPNDRSADVCNTRGGPAHDCRTRAG